MTAQVMEARRGAERQRVGWLFASPFPPGWKGPLCMPGWGVVMLSLRGDGDLSHVSLPPPLPGVLQLHVFGTPAVQV